MNLELLSIIAVIALFGHSVIMHFRFKSLEKSTIETTMRLHNRLRELNRKLMTDEERAEAENLRNRLRQEFLDY